MRLIIFAVYLGIGAMCHAFFLGPQFDWSNAWTFGWLFGWPLALMVVLCAISVVIGVIVVPWMIIDKWLGRRALKKAIVAKRKPA